MPAVAAKSDRMVYISNTTGGRDVWARDLKTGTTWALTSFRQISYRPVLSADGTRVAYPTRIDNQCAVVMQDLGNGASRNVNSGCFNLWDWSPDGSSLMVSNSAEASVSAYLWKVDTGQRQPLLSRADVSIYDAAFSPDGKWVAFSAGPSMEAAEVYVAPFHGTAIKAQEWILITQGGGSLSAWSPDGGFLYYQARRDGFHCIWAQQLGGAKHPQGEPQAILHLHTAALGMLRMKPSDFHMSVTKDRLILNLMQESSNLWITTQRE
jgi:Tol biopolymer transport system component